MDELTLLLGAILVYNFALVQFLGLCPFMGVSGQLEGAIGMSLATAFVLTLSSSVSYAVYHWALVPLQVEFLRTIAFIITIAALVQLTEMTVRRLSPLLHRILGLFLPLITSNCAVLGVALLNTYRPENDTLLKATLYGFGAAVGFSLVLILMAALRERLLAANVPHPFRGAPLGLISAGLMALTFAGFAGMV